MFCFCCCYFCCLNSLLWANYVWFVWLSKAQSQHFEKFNWKNKDATDKIRSKTTLAVYAYSLQLKRTRSPHGRGDMRWKLSDIMHPPLVVLTVYFRLSQSSQSSVWLPNRSHCCLWTNLYDLKSYIMKTFDSRDLMNYKKKSKWKTNTHHRFSDDILSWCVLVRLIE